MLKINQKTKEKTIPTFYFGEFGLLNLEIMGGLGHYFKMFPNKRISLTSYKDYGLLLQHLYPDNIVEVHVCDAKVTKRSAHESSLDRQFFKTGDKRLDGFTQRKDVIPYADNYWYPRPNKKQPPYLYLYYMDRPLVAGPKTEEKFVCMCPRFRNWNSWKNVIPQHWKESVDRVRHVLGDIQIVIIGKKEEVKNHSFFNDAIFPEDVFEQIYYLNNSWCNITPDSGIAEFTQNCGCNSILLYNRNDPIPIVDKQGQRKMPLHGFNPFGKKIEVVFTQKIMGKLGPAIRRCKQYELDATD